MLRKPRRCVKGRFYCPKCDSRWLYRRKKDKAYVCRNCSTEFTVDKALRRHIIKK